ncbi:MAG: type transport system permease protein [Chloroflexota bacterium]|jgi:ABC-2 type transport system permease protein|nr:type transport system permease protein [Chloroflexota bacterium]
MTEPRLPEQRRRSGFARLMAIVARRDYLRTVRRRGFLFGTLLLPLGIGALLTISGLASGSSFGPGSPGGGPIQLLIVNESSLPIAAASVPGVDLLSRAEADARLSSGAADEYYVIPPSYPASAQVLRIEASRKGGGLGALERQGNQESLLVALLRGALLARSGVQADIATRIQQPAVISALDQQGQPVSSGSIVASFLLPYAFTLLFVMSIFITSGYLLQSVTEEKENRVVEIVLSSVPPLPLMAGKILGLGAAGLTQVVIWVLTALVALPLLNQQLSLDVQISPLTLLLAVVYFALGYVAFGAIFAAVGALAPGSREAQQYAGFFGFLAVVPLIFSTVFLTDLNSPIVWVLSVIPLTIPATMLQVLVLSPEPPWLQIAISLAVLIAFVAVATVASARVFRATVLLYGVRPGLRRIVGAILARG